MIPRYSLPDMSAIWAEEYKFSRWLDLEIYACEAWAERGRIPKAAVTKIKKKAAIDVERILEIEEEVKHDVIAFLTSVTEKVGPEGRFIHLGLTSSDVVDTVYAYQMTAALDIISDRLKKLQKVLEKLAFKHKDSVMIGRSHGIHAEPTTFGVKCALWHAGFARHQQRIKEMRPRIAVGKLSGAVGTYANIPPALEKYVLKKMGLKPETVATQVVQRDRHAEYFNVLALVAASIEQIAVEMRHLQRTEVGEASEPFGKGQKGSSAMPHKKNPILSENLTGCARLMRHYAGASMENVALWHERDISHSSVERVIGPDATILLDFMLHRVTGMLSGVVVNTRRMTKNLNETRGLIFSQQLLLALVESGLTREDAYKRVQRHALQAWENQEDFRELVADDDVISGYISGSQLDKIFDAKRHVGEVNVIFKRVFGKTGASKNH